MKARICSTSVPSMELSTWLLHHATKRNHVQNVMERTRVLMPADLTCSVFLSQRVKIIAKPHLNHHRITHVQIQNRYTPPQPATAAWRLTDQHGLFWSAERRKLATTLRAVVPILLFKRWISIPHSSLTIFVPSLQSVTPTTAFYNQLGHVTLGFFFQARTQLIPQRNSARYQQ